MQKPQAYHFSEEEIQGLRTVFNQIDTDHNGLLNKPEMLNFLTASNMETRFLNATFKVFDHNHDDNMSFDEFLSYLDACMKTETDPTYLFRLIFDAVDANHDGKLSVEELREFSALCGNNLTEAEVKEELKRIDLDTNGFVDFRELCLAFHI